MDVVKVCGGCMNNVENLPEAVQGALVELPVDQRLSIQVGLCDGCCLDQ